MPEILKNQESVKSSPKEKTQTLPIYRESKSINTTEAKSKEQDQKDLKILEKGLGLDDIADLNEDISNLKLFNNLSEKIKSLSGNKENFEIVIETGIVLKLTSTKDSLSMKWIGGGGDLSLKINKLPGAKFETIVQEGNIQTKLLKGEIMNLFSGFTPFINGGGKSLADKIIDKSDIVEDKDAFLILSLIENYVNSPDSVDTKRQIFSYYDNAKFMEQLTGKDKDVIERSYAMKVLKLFIPYKDENGSYFKTSDTESNSKLPTRHSGVER